ncbi:unnamed protein product [Adineta steineri]|nr:unnamed protein product [Adineta steineri]
MQGGTNATTVAGSSTGSSGSTSILLNSPTDLTFDTNGFMYVVDNGNNRVQKFALGSINGTTVAGTIGSHSSALTDLDEPTAIDIDNNSNMYILDMGNTRLVKWAPNAIMGTLLISDNSLNNVYGMIRMPNSSNQVYMCDEGSDEIHVWAYGASSQNMSLQTVNDSQHNSLNNPTSMVLDPYGNLYVADTDNDRVVMYCVNSTVGIVVAEDNNSVPSLQKPVAVAFDSDLNLYLVSTDSDQVVKLSRI